jgi:hypothetical protein
MKRAWMLVPLFVLAPKAVRADEPSPYTASSPPGAPTILTGPIAPLPKPGVETRNSSTPDESVVGRARELLNRAKFLDEAAVADERVASDLAARLPTLRTAAKSARDRADRAKEPERDTLAARAEELEAELAVSEAEVAVRRRSALEDRRVARDLRQRAVRLVREAPVEDTTLASACDPPFRFTADGRKIYRIECLR